ncbi:MAG: Rrf2 family transcriptional regulator [Desulfovibrio sp.]|nr:Rrf2 family transcriptional regulator [Desulfovibrio sp.]
MLISTRGRYALRALVYLARNGNAGFVPVPELAEEQGISLKYLERIMALLTRHGLVDSASGRGGGYRLARDPAECRVGEVLRLTEGTLAPVACLEANAGPCSRSGACPTVEMWRRFHALTNSFFDNITIAALASGPDIFESASQRLPH